MRTLYLLRHAKSSWSDPSLVDQERPLAPRGWRDARRLGRELARLEVMPELVLCSTARRARETLDLLRAETTIPAPALLEPGLYAASAAALLGRILRLPDEVSSVMLIAHNPGLEELALELASSGDELERLARKYPTGALATLTAEVAGWGELAPAGATLTGFVVPKQLA
jgi:phosphohistidine phosphatase